MKSPLPLINIIFHYHQSQNPYQPRKNELPGHNYLNIQLN